MQFTSRMTSLLGRMRRERNGVVADTMRCYGRPCSLNYGVSLPTIRQIAKEEQTDSAYARYLWQQDVRELRLAALHIADPEKLSSDESVFWADGIINEELAEEAAFALFHRSTCFYELFERWITDSRPLLRYAVLMAAARTTQLSVTWIASVLGTLSAEGCEDKAVLRMMIRGVVAVLVAIGEQNEENREAVCRAVGSLGSSPAAESIHEELAWRLELS